MIDHDELIEALQQTISAKDIAIISKDALITNQEAALHDKDSLLEGKDELLERAREGEQRAMESEKKAVESERMMRQVNSSLMSAQEVQLAMLVKYYIPPVNSIELELKRAAAAGKWEDYPFDIENSESIEHKKTTWMLALVDVSGTVVVRLINRNDKKICATVKFELLGLKKELDGLFGTVDNNFQDVALMPAEEFNQKTQDLISIKTRIEMDIHRIHDTTK